MQYDLYLLCMVYVLGISYPRNTFFLVFNYSTMKKKLFKDDLTT